METILLVIYATACLGLAVQVRRKFSGRFDWSQTSLRQPVMDQSVRHNLGTGALGAADATSTAILSSATPGAVLVFCILIGGLIGGVVGGGVIPALLGGIGDPGQLGLLALLVATLAWVFIGGYLTLPVLMLAFSTLPIVLGLGALGFAAFFLAAMLNERQGHPSFSASPDSWSARLGARLDHNVCAAGTSLITFGSPLEVARKCRRTVIGTHPIEGQYAGTYQCGSKRITALVDLHSVGGKRDGVKSGEVQISDRPEQMFPQGFFAVHAQPTKRAGEFIAQDFRWARNPGPGWGLPTKISFVTLPSGELRMELMGAQCTVLQAQRCAPAVPGKTIACTAEFAAQGIKPNWTY